MADQRLHPQQFQNMQESTVLKRRREWENRWGGDVKKLTKGNVRNAAVMLSEAKHLGIGKVKVSEGDVRNWGHPAPRHTKPTITPMPEPCYGPRPTRKEHPCTDS